MMELYQESLVHSPRLVPSETVADFKAVRMNAMHSSIQITDQFFSNIPDREFRIE